MGRIWMLDDNVNTDVIIPGRYNVTTDHAQLARYCLCEVLPEFAQQVQEGDVVMAGQLPTPLSDASAVVLGGRILILGGRNRAQILDTVMRFDPASGRTSIVGRLPYPVADAGAAVVDGVGYLVGGEGPAKTASSVIVRYR